MINVSYLRSWQKTPMMKPSPSLRQVISMIRVVHSPPRRITASSLARHRLHRFAPSFRRRTEVGLMRISKTLQTVVLITTDLFPPAHGTLITPHRRKTNSLTAHTADAPTNK